jgi:RNA polymerase sigma-70 factor (ECF subfamily)
MMRGRVTVVGVIDGVEVTLTVEDLFRRHVDDVCRIASRLLGPRATEADVDDIVQHVFLAIHRALPRFRGDSEVRTWIYGITARVVLQHLRTNKRYRAMIERFEAASMIAPSSARIDETVEQRQALERIYGALSKMKAEKRVVFVLSEIEGWSAPEIGAALELGEEAVRSRLRRAREELAAEIARVKEEQR